MMLAILIMIQYAWNHEPPSASLSRRRGFRALGGVGAPAGMDEIPGDPGGCSRPHPPERRGPPAGAERDGRRTPGGLQRAVQSPLRGDHHCGAPRGVPSGSAANRQACSSIAAAGSPLPASAISTTPKPILSSGSPQRSGYRSEEHTSELQSLAYLVCRPLL